MFLTIFNKCKKSEMPDKTKMFLTALYFWGVILYYISTLFNFMLRIIITHIPDYLTVIPRPLKWMPFNKLGIFKNTPVVKPVILDAKIHDSSHNIMPFTNKLKLLIATLWDEDIGDELLGSDVPDGGLNLKDLSKVMPDIKNMCIIAKYIFEKNVDKIPDQELREHVKFIFIDFADNLIYRDESRINKTSADKIDYGDIGF